MMSDWTVHLRNISVLFHVTLEAEYPDWCEIILGWVHRFYTISNVEKTLHQESQYPKIWYSFFIACWIEVSLNEVCCREIKENSSSGFELMAITCLISVGFFVNLLLDEDYVVLKKGIIYTFIFSSFLSRDCGRVEHRLDDILVEWITYSTLFLKLVRIL